MFFHAMLANAQILSQSSGIKSFRRRYNRMLRIFAGRSAALRRQYNLQTNSFMREN